MWGDSPGLGAQQRGRAGVTVLAWGHIGAPAALHTHAGPAPIPHILMLLGTHKGAEGEGNVLPWPEGSVLGNRMD